MGGLIRGSIFFPHAVFAVTFLVVLFGILSAQRIPLQMRPSVDNPEITVTTDYPGASPEEIEDKLTRPIEEALNAVEGVRKLTSTSIQGRSRVTLEFDWDIKRDAAMVDVLNKLSRVSSLPEEALAPVAEAISSDTSNPMMWIGFQHIDPKKVDVNVNAMRILIDDMIEPRLRRVDGVGSLIISGGQQREVQIIVDLQRMAQHKIPLSQMIALIRSSHLTVRGGPFDSGKREYVVWTSGRSSNLDDLKKMVLLRNQTGVIRLSDVARVASTHKRAISIMRLNGQTGIGIGILRKTGSNVPATAAKLEKQITQLNLDFKQKGEPYALKILFTEVAYINQSIDLVKSNLISGSILAILVLLIFLGSWRSVIVIALSIPTSIIAVFLVMEPLGRSLNIISLAGLAFAVGMVVDNAIVVLENIYSYMNKGLGIVESCVKGTEEVGLAIGASTLTTVAVFFPIIFLKTEAGQIFKDIALAISAAVTFSLIVALTIVPMLCRLILRPAKKSTEQGASWLKRSWEGLGDKIGLFYDRTLAAFVRRDASVRRLSLFLVILAFFVASIAWLPSAEYLPNGNRNMILTLARPLPGMNLEKVVEAAGPLERYLLERKETSRIFTVFNQRFNAIGTVLKDEYGDSETMQKVLQDVRKQASQAAGFRFLFPILASIFRIPGKQFEVEISGPDLRRLSALASLIESQLKGLQGVISVRSDFEEGALSVQVVPRRQSLVEKGLSASAVGESVQVALGGLRVGYYLDRGREIDLTLIGASRDFTQPEDLRTIPMISQDRKLVYLQAIADVREERAPTAINRLEMMRAITLTVNLAPSASLGSLLQDTERFLLAPMRASIPGEYTLRMGDTADRLNETLRDLIGSFALALIISYLLLVALFRSFLYPFIIMFTVPMAATGACLAVGLTGVSFDTITMLGFVILSGVVVNNAILIVSQTVELLDQGASFEEALRLGASSRLRPMMMTALTSIIGMLPLAAGSGTGTELYRGLGVAIVGGLTLSTLVTLYLTPAMLGMVEDMKGIFSTSRYDAAPSVAAYKEEMAVSASSLLSEPSTSASVKEPS